MYIVKNLLGLMDNRRCGFGNMGESKVIKVFACQLS